MRAIFSMLFEVIKIAFMIAVIIVPIRYYLFKPFSVQGASMEPTFEEHEYLIIDEISYRFHEPARGDVMVFRYPKNPSEFFIKRLIALPGETIVVSDGHITIFNADHPDGVILEESYLDDSTTHGVRRVELKADEYFVMGDHRDASLDSRSFGPIRREDIVGRVWLRGFPFTRIATFPSPSYPF
jgi:signal peptidase I